MVVNPLPFTVIQDPLGTPKDITEFISSIDSCKFQGTGRIRTASIMLNAKDGAFITNTNGGDTPQVNQFDAFKISWQDENENLREGIFEVDSELGQTDENGNLLPLELKGRERAWQDMKTTAYFEFITPFAAISTLNILYNANRGSIQPETTIQFVGTGPLFGVTNIYDFTSEMTYYDALMHIIERLNQPTGAGGVGDFYSAIFNENAGDPSKIDLLIKIQGTGGSDIFNPITAPVHSLTYRIDSQIGNQVFVRGQPNTGAVPNGFHEFSSFVEEINNYPAYNIIATYAIGQKVIENGIIFEATQIVPPSTPPPDTEWTATTASTIIGPVVYSEWTNNKALVTKNSCSNPEQAFLTGGFNAPAFPDGNLVVRESFYERDFVLGRSVNPDALATDVKLKFYLRNQLLIGLYSGFRLLVDSLLGTPPNGTPFSDGAGGFGSDRFNRPFKDAMVQWTGFEWIVFLIPMIPTIQLRAISHCCVLSEGKVYEFNKDPTAGGLQKLAIRKATVFAFRGGTGNFAWRDISTASSGNDAFHHPANIESVGGLITDTIRSNQDISSFLVNSAIKITYEYDLASQAHALLLRIGGWFDTAIDNLERLFDNPIEETIEPTTGELADLQQTDYYDFGWWYALPFPYPLSEFNSIPEKVGDIYGLGTDTSGLNNAFFGHLDIQNTTFSSQGKTGLNHDQSDDLGSPFSALAFLFSFDMIAAGTRKPFEGDIPFTVTIYDDLSQVWRADYIYRHLGDVQDFIMPFSSFTVDRPSRAPWDIDTIAINLLHTPELEIRSIFQERRVRLITWQLKTSYDSNERYLPFNTDNFFTNLIFGALVKFETEGIIDGLRLTKQPFVSSGVELTRVLNAETIQASQTRNKRQLQSIAFAEQQRQSLQLELYTYETEIKCNLQTEQSIFVENADMIKFAELNRTELDQWVTATNYGEGATVKNFTEAYRCKVAHKSALINQPNTGVDFAIFWDDVTVNVDFVNNTRKTVLMSENFRYNAEGKRGGAIMEVVLGKRLNA